MALTEANGNFVRSADLVRRKMLRNARTTVSVKLRCGVVAQLKGRQWAERTDAAGQAGAISYLRRKLREAAYIDRD